MKERRFYIMLVAFLMWLGALGIIVIRVLNNPDLLDPSLQVIGGISAGAITQFFITMLTLSWQFWFRKEPAPPVTP